MCSTIKKISFDHKVVYMQWTHYHRIVGEATRKKLYLGSLYATGYEMYFFFKMINDI